MTSSTKQEIQPVTISFTEELSPGIFLIGFKRRFDFMAGQVIGIAIRKDDARRLYSICSGEQDEEISILYKVVEEGYLTPQLSDLEAGDTIWVTPPAGEFTGTPGPAVWVPAATHTAGPGVPVNSPSGSLLPLENLQVHLDRRYGLLQEPG